MRLKIALWTILGLTLSTAPAWACSCAGRPSVADALRSYDAIFLGRATILESAEMEESGFLLSDLKVGFEVHRSFKGNQNSGATVYTASTTPACGYPFVQGNLYLVYASGNNKTGSIGTSTCSRTHRVFWFTWLWPWSDAYRLSNLLEEEEVVGQYESAHDPG